MNILITGGTGFIGTALCPLLVESGHHLSVLTRRRGMPDTPGIRWAGRLDEVDAADAVINLAGESLTAGRWNDARKRLFRESRIGTTRALVDWMAARAVPPRVLVSGSAIGYYGPRDNVPLDETAKHGGDFAAMLCRDWEAEAQRAETLGTRVCRLRTGIVLGRDGGALARMLPAFRMGMGGPLGNGRQWMSWIHRDDLVRLILWLLETPTVDGACNGTAPRPVTNADFARALGAALHRPARLPMPAPALRLMLGEMASLLLTGQRVLPIRAQAGRFRFRYPELDVALRDVLR